MRPRFLPTVVFVLVACLALPASVAAQQDGADFGPENSDWNGLSDFLQLAEAQDVAVETSKSLDYEALDPKTDIVLIIHPAKPLDVSNLSAYVVDGGRVLLADDFGAADSFLDRLEITRLQTRMGNLPHDAFVRDNPALPIFEIEGKHPMLGGVDTVVGNHPTVLTNVGGPVVAYDKGGGVVYDMNLGDGKVVVMGDPSMLINHMLEVSDNRAFAENTVRYLCEGRQPCKGQLLIGEFDQIGRYDEKPSEATDWSEKLADLNETLRRMMENLPTRQLLYFLGILLAAGLALYLAAVFPVRKSQPYSGYIDDSNSEVPDPQAEFDWNLSRFGEGGRETNYALPLAILKELFEEMFLRTLGRWQDDERERADVETLGAEFREQFLGDVPPNQADKMEAEVVDLLATFAKIPTRHRVFLDSDAYFSERELIDIYRRATDVLSIMGLEEEYERRTSSLV